MCVHLCVNVCAQKIKEEGAIEGAEKRQSRKFQDPRRGDHQPGMADSREQAAGRVQSRRGAPLTWRGCFWHYFNGCNKPFAPYFRGSL